MPFMDDSAELVEPCRRTGRPLVLFVDDDPRVLAAIRRCLRREWYDVATAESAREALERLARGAADLVVADQRMPGMTGTDLLEEIRLRFPFTPCAILTGDHALTIIRDGGRAGASAVLFKPWKDQSLRTTVRRLLGAPEEEGPLGSDR
jgi:CheY-like chemotaxis protein